MKLDSIGRWIAWRLPRVVARWAFYRVVVDATTGRWSKTLIPGLQWETAIRRWDLGDDPCCPPHDDGNCTEDCDNCDDWCCPQEPAARTKEAKQ